MSIFSNIISMAKAKTVPVEETIIDPVVEAEVTPEVVPEEVVVDAVPEVIQAEAIVDTPVELIEPTVDDMIDAIPADGLLIDTSNIIEITSVIDGVPTIITWFLTDTAVDHTSKIIRYPDYSTETVKSENKWFTKLA